MNSYLRYLPPLQHRSRRNCHSYQSNVSIIARLDGVFKFHSPASVTSAIELICYHQQSQSSAPNWACRQTFRETINYLVWTRMVKTLTQSWPEHLSETLQCCKMLVPWHSQHYEIHNLNPQKNCLVSPKAFSFRPLFLKYILFTYGFVGHSVLQWTQTSDYQIHISPWETSILFTSNEILGLTLLWKNLFC